MNHLHAASWAMTVLALAGAVVAVGASDPVGMKTLRYDILVGRRAVGEVRLEVLTVANLTVLEEDFSAPFGRGGSTMAGAKSQITYKGEETPKPARGEATTRIGDYKIMEGKVTFEKTDGQWSAKAEATGFANIERKPFETARQWTKTLTTGGDLLLTNAAFLYFAPRLLPKPGKIENVTLVQFPDDVGFPGILAFFSGCVLERHEAGPDGKADITLHRVYAGGNIKPVLTMTVGKDGKMVEAKRGVQSDGQFKFTLRPQASVLEE